MGLNNTVFVKPQTSCKNVLSAGGKLLLGKLKNCDKTPKLYTVSNASAITATDTTASLTIVAPNVSGDSVYLRKGFVLPFGTQLITLADAVTLRFGQILTVPIISRPASAATILSNSLVNNAVAEMLEIESTTDLPVNFADTMIDITDLASGLQGQQTKVGFDLTLPINFRYRADDKAIHQILVPYELSNEEVYFVLSQGDPTGCGFFLHGSAIISNLQTQAPLKQIVTGTVSLLTQPPTAVITKVSTLSLAAQTQAAIDFATFGFAPRTN